MPEQETVEETSRMDTSDIPDDAAGDDPPPEFDELEPPESIFEGGPVWKRLYEVIIGLHAPAEVSEIADSADCDPETVRDLLDWFDRMRIVHHHDGPPVRYERNDAYFQWRWSDRIREDLTEQEIAEVLADTLEKIDDYRARFGIDDPDEVTLAEASQDMPTEDAWEALSAWKTLERRATLLEAAQRDPPVPGRSWVRDCWWRAVW